MESDSSCASFLSFPAEVISYIMNFLDLHDLLRCSEVCRPLRKLTQSSPLQYRIELGMHRMVSFKTSDQGPSFATRRKFLRQRELSWRHFNWHTRHALKISTHGSIYEFIGGFYGNCIAPSISLVELPSTSPDSELDTPGRTWVHTVPDITIVDFTMDPSQDLLVLLANAPAESAYVYDLHIRTMSTGEPHPQAECAILNSFKRDEVPIGDFELWSSFRVQIVGDFLALLVKESEEAVGSQLQIWNYKRRPELNFVITLKVGIDDFSFISTDTFLIVTPLGFIEIWQFEDPSISTIEPAPKVKFALPALADGFIYWYMSASANPTTGCIPATDLLSTAKPLYYPCPDERIHAFCIYLLNPDEVNGRCHTYVFFVNIHTMLHPPQAACEFLASSTEPDAPIPWEAWGPQNTRWFAEPINTDWQHSLYGYRTVEALPPREPETDANPVPKCNLRIRDFNPYGLARMQEVDGYGGGGSGSECWRGRVVREPSTISGQEAFAYDVVSHLPYCEIVSKEAFEITDVMMDDCRILLLKRAPEGHLASIDVLTF